MTAAHPFPFRVGAASADITPPLEVGILMSCAERRWEPFRSVRLPLHARVVTIEPAGPPSSRPAAARVALVSMELLGFSVRAFGGWDAPPTAGAAPISRFASAIARHAKRAVAAERIVLSATHTHSSPETMALTGLYRTPAFKAWAAEMARRIGLAIAKAVARPHRAFLAAGSSSRPGLAIHRRIKTTEGVVLSHPPPPPEKVISRAGPVDDAVNALFFLGLHDRPVAAVVNAVCHPVHEMCLARVSPDYPGVMCTELARRHKGATVLFLNGAAGNINPPGVSDGPQAADAHGLALADAVDRALTLSRDLAGGYGSRPDATIRLLRRRLVLPARTLQGRPATQRIRTTLAGLRLGQAAVLFLPGEPFVEIGLGLQRASPFHPTLVAGYAEDSIGYVPTDAAFDEGGYELGPGPWSRVDRGSAGKIEREALALLEELKAERPGARGQAVRLLDC